MTKTKEGELTRARDEFVAQWGALGTSWGINRTMAKVHALMLSRQDCLSTDEVMDELEISRGNAHTNLKELVSWGLVRLVVKKGERREFFEAERDVWKIFTIIARERKRREIDPALETLRRCAEDTKDIGTEEATAFHKQVSELEEFVSLASRVGDSVSQMKYGPALKLAAKIFG